MSGEVIRLSNHADKRADPAKRTGRPRKRPPAPDSAGLTDTTARITPRSARGRGARPPVIPAADQLGRPEPTRVPPLRAVPDMPSAPPGREPDEWDRRVADLLAFLRRRITGEYELDEFGFDADLSDHLLLPALRQLYRRWFRTEVSGIGNVPEDGSALLVANHSGTVALDALMLTVAVHDEHPGHRHLRLLGADFVFSTPLLASLARKGGATLACQPDAERLLRSGELVGVFPEGFKGVGKPFSERYKLQRFGRGGFVSAALRTAAPIVPVSIVGAEEIYPKIGDIKPLARLLNLPYFPVTPLFPWLGPLGMIPLPSKWLIEFGEPIQTAELSASADDPMVVFNLADQVRETIQQTLYQMLLRRESAFG